MKSEYRVNSLIKNRIIKLINYNSKYLGIFKIFDCFKRCKILKNDLVEIGTKNNFSICKITNYKKFMYFQSKKLKKNYKTDSNLIVKTKKCKEIKFHLFTFKNDYINKIKLIKKFFIKKMKVKITIIVKGREILKNNLIELFINKIKNSLNLWGVLTNKPVINNKFIFMYFDFKNVKSKN